MEKDYVEEFVEEEKKREFQEYVKEESEDNRD